eukprot:2800046-Pyramimonas_sp.AAC.1
MYQVDMSTVADDDFLLTYSDSGFILEGTPSLKGVRIELPFHLRGVAVLSGFRVEKVLNEGLSSPYLITTVGESCCITHPYELFHLTVLDNAVEGYGGAEQSAEALYMQARMQGAEAWENESVGVYHLSDAESEAGDEWLIGRSRGHSRTSSFGQRSFDQRSPRSVMGLRQLPLEPFSDPITSFQQSAGLLDAIRVAFLIHHVLYW